MTPTLMEVNRQIKYQWSAVKYFQDTYSRFYLNPRSEKVTEEVKLAIADNEEADRDIRAHFEKGNLVNYV